MDHPFRSYGFTGGGESLQVASISSPSPPLTIACWFRASKLSGSTELVNFSDSFSSTLHAYRLNLNGTTAVRAISTASGSSAIATGPAPTTGRWMHALASFAASNSRTAYLNGVPGSANTTSSTPTSPNKMNIGRYDTAAGLIFTGQVALPWAWGATLTADEIRALAAGALPWEIRPGAALTGWAFRHGDMRGRVGSIMLQTAGGAPYLGDGPPVAIRRYSNWPAIAAAAATTIAASVGIASGSVLGNPGITFGAVPASVGIATGSVLGAPVAAYGALAASLGIASGSVLGDPAASFGAVPAEVGIAEGSVAGDPSANVGGLACAVGLESASVAGDPVASYGTMAAEVGVASASVAGPIAAAIEGAAIEAGVGIASGSVVGSPVFGLATLACAAGIASGSVAGPISVSVGTAPSGRSFVVLAEPIGFGSVGMEAI